MPYPPGEILLGKYRIEASLGHGAFGEVYRVTNLALNVQRAVKVLRQDAPGLGSSEFSNYKARFQFEAQLGARLNSPSANPHLLQIHSYEEKADLLLLEMEYAPGGSLAEHLSELKRQGKVMPLEAAMQMGIEVAQGLSALHAQDIVHRDLKPSNILFDQNGHARVADLGLAQAPGGDSLRSQLSTPKPHPGTPAYMSPEQETTRSYLTSSSDVYSLGLVLFEALTGRMYRSQLPGTRLRMLRLDSPRWLDDLLARMLLDDPKARPWNGEAVARLLQEGQSAKKAAEKGASAKFKKPSNENIKPVQQLSRSNPKTKIKISLWVWIIPVVLVVITFLAFWATRRWIPAQPAAASPTRTLTLTEPTFTPIITQPAIHNFTPIPSTTPETIPTPFGGGLGKIAFVSYRDGLDSIYTMNSDGSQVVRLTNTQTLISNPSWSPDGRRIAFTCNSGSDNNYNRDICLINSDGTNFINLTSSNPSNDEYSSWSPDGKYIAFESERDGYAEIYVMNSDGSNPIRLTNLESKNTYPSWSPDGKYIAFFSNRDGQGLYGYGIYVMNSDGSHPIRLMNSLLTNYVTFNQLLSWSPDNKYIVFASHDEIYSMDSDGSNPVRLTNNDTPGSSPDSPAWSPDGKLIAYESYQDSNCKIFVMGSDGSNPVQLTNNADCGQTLSWAP